MKKLLLVCCCLFLYVLPGYGQRDTVKAYPRGSLYLGLNSGMAWQKADVRSHLGVGWGITLEKILTQRKSPYLGWALRGRYLHSNTWGRDREAFYGFENDPAVNGSYNSDLNYSGTGYLYSNYATSMNELSLELKVFFNRAWHRSGISPYAFGGLGAMGYKAMIDQLDYDGTMYDYSGISDMPRLASYDLKNLRDQEYESPAENKGQPHWVFTPGFGGGLAIRLGYGASLGFEHKVSLPNTDLMDGQRWTRVGLLSTKKDVHHYTNFWVNFRIFGKYVPKTVNNYREPTPVVYKPVLRVIRSEVSENCDAIIEMETQYITSASQIRVMLNGRYLYASDFSFNNSEQKIRIHRKIQGSATFTITSTTAGGSASETIELACTPPVVVPVAPQITILQPTNTATQSCNVFIKAQLSEISRADQIMVLKNERPLSSSDYVFHESTGILEIRDQLQSHTDYVIKVRNEVGEKSVTVNYSCNTAPTVKTPAPEIVVLNPTTTPFVTPSCEYQLKAEIKHILRKDQIQILVNGMLLKQWMYQYNVQSRLLTLPMLLEANPMVVEIKATNESGTASQTRVVSCGTSTPPPMDPPPFIELIDPAVPTFETDQCPYKIIVHIDNVDNIDQIKILKNGQYSPGFNWQWNATNHTVIWYTDNNINSYLVMAQNNAGKAQQTISVKCKPAAPLVVPPVITITAPVASPFEAPACSYLLKAEVLNVARKDQIQVWMNNSVVPATQYQFDATVHLLSMQVNIPDNGASIRIRASNSAGQDQKTQQLTCSKPTPIVPIPVITLIDPTTPMIDAFQCPYKITVKVENIQSKNQLSVLKNNVAIPPSSWQWDSSKGTVTWYSEDQPVNSYTIVAENESGKTQKKITVNCTPEVIPAPVLEPPSVVITNPSTNPFEAPECSYLLKAEVLNIKTKDQLKIWVNNTLLTIYQYRFDPGMHQLSVQLSIPATGATVRILATNEGGSAQKEQTIACTPPIDRKIMICHYPPGNHDNPQTIEISESAWPAHQAHGDVMGTCPVKEPDPVIPVEPKKITICHYPPGNHDNPQTIEVSEEAWPAHQAHGDLMGTCPVKEPDPVIPAEPKKITICHYPPGNHDNPQTIEVSEEAWPAHQAHGDVMGTCPVKEPDPVIPVEPKKITICHYPPGNHDNPQTIEVSEEAWPAHQAHGDLMGTCPVKEPDPVIPAEPKKITICHYPPGNKDNPQTIEISESAWPAHEAHGDIMGTCPVKTPEPPPADFDFQITDGTVVPNKTYCAEIKVIGSALKVGGDGEDLPVMVRVNLGSEKVDPFGSYGSFNASANVNDRHTHTWRSSSSISANTPISISAKSFMPGKTTPLYERNSNRDLVMVKVLRNGSTVPSITGFNGQADAESYLKPYISGNKIVLEENQAIYLFELGTNTTSSTAYDLQDCVIIVSLKEDCHFSGSTSPVRYAPDPVPAEKPATVEKKITICHYPPGNTGNPQTIEISESAWPAHKAHGDVMGACPAKQPEPEKPREDNNQNKNDNRDNGSKEREDNNSRERNDNTRPNRERMTRPGGR